MRMSVFGPPGDGDRIARRLFVPLAVLLGALLLVFWVFFSSLEVTGDSMLEVLHNGDRVLVTRGYTTPERGDIVHIDGSELEGARGDQVIKRVIALAGDTVLIQSGRAIVNGQMEETESVLLLTADDVSVPETTVPEGHLYVLGDNRPDSLDSRFYGPVPITTVEGRLVFCYTPITRFGPID
jgi:signal peptidase I